MTETPVVTCFLRHRGEVLLLRRSGEVGSYRGRWGAVAGYAEGGDPDDDARREIAEETGLPADAVELVRRGEPFAVDDADLGRRWIVHPYLWDCARREVRLDRESTAAEWVAPGEILRRETVPELWTSYARVAPSVASIAADREHGSAWLGLRALEVLRDRAAWLAWGARPAAEADGARGELEELARRLLAARPAMAVLANRVDRLMREGLAAWGAGGKPPAGDFAEAAQRAVGRALAADDGAARRAAGLAAGRTVLTLSRSGTVESALLAARPPPAVVVAESRPGGEGVGTAERLAAAGLAVTLIADAALGWALAGGLGRSIDLVLVGADAVLPDGAVVNKTGTRLAALAARAAGVPLYAVAVRDKVAAGSQREPGPELEAGDPADLYAGAAPLAAANPLFEVTPADLVTAVVTEDATLAPAAVAGVAAELAATAGRW